jgi:three-Cys-motif partner protein
MPIRDLHRNPFDEATLDKLSLYRDYLREWLPVFMNNRSVDTIQVFDFFAGPGIDREGNPGSPVIACDEIRRALEVDSVFSKKIKLFFNEVDKVKHSNLISCINEQKATLPRVEFNAMQEDFPDAFRAWNPLMHGWTANLLFLDQNGVKQITKAVFQDIVRLARTDFLFFISSAMINRFKEQPEIRNYVPVTNGDFARMTGTNVHRIVAEAYRRWIPDELEYYLGSFSIKKGANVYGLIFGSGHPLGIDKFLKLAWKRGGDANFDIDKDGIDPAQPSLFPELDKPTKIRMFEKELEAALFKRQLRTNKDIYLFALRNGMLARHAKDALNLLVKDKKLPKQSFHISYDAWKKAETENILLF